MHKVKLICIWAAGLTDNYPPAHDCVPGADPAAGLESDIALERGGGGGDEVGVVGWWLGGGWGEPADTSRRNK